MASMRCSIFDGGPGVSDGKISSSDPVYAQLRLWIDENHNGFSESSELHGLTEFGVTAIYTGYWGVNKVDRKGNLYKYGGLALIANHRGVQVPRVIYDVFLAHEP